tara:strand:+ start:120217 stop:120744 length:528 start_codon:yes stop_codon:yes gene_type:complete
MQILLKSAIVLGFIFSFGHSHVYSQNNSAVLSAKINGHDFTVNGGEDFNQIYGVLAKTPMFFQLSISGSTIDNGIAKSIVISIMSEKSFKTVVQNTEWDSKNESLGDLPVGFYYEIENDIEKEASSESTEDAYLKITSIDKTKHLISGEFRFTASNGVNNYNITHGVFTDVSYKK